MIYQLNNETHWEISPEVMREVVFLIDSRLKVTDVPPNDKLVIGLSNLRGAFECELFRLKDAKPVKPPAGMPMDDLIS